MKHIDYTFLDELYEGAYVVDQNRKILFWNKESEHITGYSKQEVIGEFCYNNLLRHVDDKGNRLCFSGCPLQNTLETGKQNNANVFLHHKKGHRVPVQVKSIPVYDDNQTVVASIELFSGDLNNKHLYKENRALAEALNIDPLTQVYNRKFIDYQLSQIIEEIHVFKTSLGLLFIDIDHFKNVNDTYGHTVGDEVLKLIAKTLEMHVRANDFVGRFGGEEFVVLLRDVNQKELSYIAEKLRILVEQSTSFTDQDEPIHVTISIGGTFYQKGDTVSSLIKRADENMYYAKSHGRNQTKID
ncbi:MAG: GGDEF domain-containing protein [Candidatus Izimaplasma sp.]|nr:GGDEF domain-containing protein [Candidatus Izimaplasma bacterium]